MERTSYQTHHRAGNGIHKAYLARRMMTASKLKRLSLWVNPLHRTLLSIEKCCFEDPQLQQLFVNSHMVANELCKNYTTERDKISVIHNGVEWKQFAKPFDEWSQKKKEHCKRLGLDISKHQFVFIGQGYRRKGLLPLLQGLAMLKERSWQLSVVGKENKLHLFQREAHRLGLNERIFFHGQQKNVIPFYQVADTLCIPSTYDPFANVTVEALAMGVFVVSSRYNGGHEVLTPESGAIIENLEDPKQVAAALEQALDNPKTDVLSERIRKGIRHLNFEKQQARLVDLTLEKL
jgi:UDP-glucose:(heptosyl)LPS alpha-1,3-glucosyltransferase